MKATTPHFINGKPYLDVSEHTKALINPCSGEIIGSVPFARINTIQAALKAAQQSYPIWSQTTPWQRAKLFFDFREIMKSRQNELAKVVTREHGKTLDDAKGSIARGIELLEWCCGLVNHWQSTFTHQAATGVDCYTLRQSLGVCVGVSPFNFPVMVPMWMMLPAIACGNTFILKPSEQTPTAALLLATWLTEAGLLPGVINIVHGDKEAVATLITAKEVEAVTAVASTKVAAEIYQQAVSLNKRAHTFGGAKNHAVVMPDANLEETVKAILGAAFGSAGQRCMALSVVVTVGQDCKEALLAKLIPRAKAIKIGSGEDKNVDMGPLISKTHLEKVESKIALGMQEGARLCLDGRGFQHPQYKQGNFLGPCIFDNVTPIMQIYQEEIFGPVLVVLVVNSLKEAITLVNNHPFGNGTAIFTQDGRAAKDYVENVKVGMVGVNIPIPVPIVSHPFGGWKKSAFGDTAMHGIESIHFYTKHKTVTTRWPGASEDKIQFEMPTSD